MKFEKGHRPWNKGLNLLVEYRQKLSSSHKGKPLSDTQRQALQPVTDFRQTEDGRRTIYTRYGYSLLVIWESDLTDKAKIITQVKQFVETRH